MYRGNLQRTGTSSSTAPLTSGIKWIYNTTAEVNSSPADSNGRLIVGISSGDVVALNSTTGAHLWTYAGESGQNSIWSGPAIDSCKVYIGNRLNNLLCLDEGTGELLWRYSSVGEVDSSPSVKDGRVYYATTVENAGGGVFSTEFYCLNSTDGSLLWNYQVDNQRWDFSSPAIFGDKFYGCTCTSLYALDALNGNRLWNISISNDNTPITSTPVVSNGKIYVSAGASLTCVDATSAAILWTKTSVGNQTVGAFRSSPAITGDNLILCSGFGTVFSFNAQTGELNWKSKVTEREIWSSPVVAGGQVLVGAGDGKLYCLNLNDGSLIWSKYTLERIVSSPAVCDSTVYVGCGGAMSGEGRIYAFGAKYMELSSLTLSLGSQTSFLGFKVRLSGMLSSEDGPVADVPITLSFSVNCGETWNDITAVPTDVGGHYEAVWVPSATGTYIIKASWRGEYPLSPVEQSRSLSVTLYDNQYVFSVVSNSTVSALSFNSANQELRFVVGGETGTSGFVEVMIAKSLVPNILDLTVLLDQTNLQYQVTSLEDSWLLTFDYIHSTHNVVVAFKGSNENMPSPTPISIGNFTFSSESLMWAVVGLCALVAVLAVYIVIKAVDDKRRVNVQQKPPAAQ